MKIVELKIDENIEKSGYDAIAFTETPAIEQDFMAFSKNTYADYPQSARNAAKRGIELNKEVNNRCATLVGKQRAQQLVSGEKLSIDTIKRMRSFLIRQRDNYNLAISRKDYTACGYISYLLWGGPSALPWAEKKLRQSGYQFSQEEHDEMNEVILENILLLELGEECVGSVYKNEETPTHMIYNSFTQELQEKQMIIAPIMRADYMIPRIDKEGNEYQVFFSADTIKQIAYKAMKDGKVHNVNLEHDSNFMLDGVYMTETWLVEDPEKDKSTLYGFSPNKGDWYGMYKIDNKEVWNTLVKTGKVKGVSIEGWFLQNLIK
jgi:hypothetical protein